MVLGKNHADMLTKKGALTPFLEPNLACGVGRSMLKSELHKFGLRGTSHKMEVYLIPKIA